MPTKLDNRRPVYIQMHNYNPVRKDLLESAIKSVELLERYEYIKETRSLKREKLKQARQLFQGISTDLSSLSRILPQASIKRKDKKLVDRAREEAGKKPLQVKTKKGSNSELKRLESELYEIKTKLDSLSI